MAPNGHPRAAGAKLIGTAATVLSLAVAAGAHAGAGGAEPKADPSVDDVRCLKECAGPRKAAVGSKIELTGKGLGETTEISFNRDGGGRVEAAATNPRGRSVRARVPDGAVTGKPRAVDADGATLQSPEELKIVDADQLPDEGEFELQSVIASPSKVFVYGKAKAKAKFTFDGAQADVVIEVQDRDSGRIVRRIVRKDQAPFAEHRVKWDGKRGNGKPAPRGKYRFRVGAQGGAPTKSSTDARFELHDHIFPIRAKHYYGDGLGAGRGHQGQDVFAKCGSKLVAARAGKVQYKRFQSAAGYYLVIDGKGTGKDYAYMHMKRRGRPSEGTRVKTGEKIGQVSDTGNASGCHLHFELWSAPGWYEGGSPTNPTDDLKRWDRYS